MTRNAFEQKDTDIWRQKILAGSPLPLYDSRILFVQNETNGGKLSTDELGGKHESSYVASSLDSNDHQEATPERYPEILDIDEMDYSQARRKPPIHN